MAAAPQGKQGSEIAIHRDSISQMLSFTETNIMKPISIARGIALLFAAISLASLAGCGGAPQKYYRLSADGSAPTATAGLSVGVGPVTLPGYVDRAELVFQSSANEFQVPTDAHWAGSLKENISAVLATDLGERLHSGNVVSFPWNPVLHLRYSVAVDVAQFHAVSGQGAMLEVSWRVLGGSDGQLISRHNARYEERVTGDGYDAVVSAESRLLGKLADGMAASLRGR